MRAVLIHIIGPDKGKRERFDAGRISIGRASDNALCFNDGQRRVSSHHAEIVRNDDHYLLRDLGSTNGTMINGRRVVTSEIQHDDLIEFGAGGPLLRFLVEFDETDSPEARQSLSSAQPARRNTTEPLARPPSHKANGLLLVAIAAAMLNDDLLDGVAHFHLFLAGITGLKKTVESGAADLGQPAHRLHSQAALRRHHFPDRFPDAVAPDPVPAWLRAPTFAQAAFKKSTSSVFFASAFFS